ncbi:YozQ family protein [Alteribacillus sp. YIM 98480]|uniref:YozQ family protein n=1 Tax=Alteribacillus sp. YIM 98480 TaxID=2606599 RepID=UPI00131C6064|nr:YozQ family protein [Alteribacillus sp. YIM 98480]
MDNNQQRSKIDADKTYHPSDYTSTDQSSKGLASTHEQVSDTYTEGTIDGSIDEVDENGNLVSHEGRKIKRK